MTKKKKKGGLGLPCGCGMRDRLTGPVAVPPTAEALSLPRTKPKSYFSQPENNVHWTHSRCGPKQLVIDWSRERAQPQAQGRTSWIPSEGHKGKGGDGAGLDFFLPQVTMAVYSNKRSTCGLGERQQEKIILEHRTDSAECGLWSRCLPFPNLTHISLVSKRKELD
jgi:hypothetical protein